ncbi:MAG: helix-turn-helix domain-containing protein [Spirochaetia bacterium]|nr:helix-turn-helix domain-containing protein [Spirochaetia bacterium]
MIRISLYSSYFIVILFFLQAPAFSQNLYYNKDYKVSYLKDETIGHNFQSIKEEKNNWKSLPDNTLNIGYIPEGAWLKLEINNETRMNEDLYFSFLMPFFDYAALEAPDSKDNSKILIKETGDTIQHHKWDFDSPYPVLKINSAFQKIFYIKINFAGLVNFPAVLETESGLQHRVYKTEIVEVVYASFLFIIIFYALVLFWRTKDMLYLFYLAYAICVFASSFISLGSGYRVLWPNYPSVQNKAQMVVFMLSVFFAVNFAYRFLRVKFFLNKISYLYRFLSAAFIFLIILKLITAHNASWQKPIFLTSGSLYLVFSILVLSNAVIIYKKGYRPALFYLCAWGLVIFAYILNMLYFMSILPYHFMIVYLGVFLLPLDFIVFSIALLSKYNIELKIENYFPIKEPESTSYKRSYIQNIEIEDILNSLKHLMEEKKIYKDDPELNIKKLARMLKIKSHQLTEILNQIMGTNFATFLKKYKIEEAKELLSQNSESRIIDIAFESGFQSKSAFNNAFKQITGMAPSEYLKNYIS